jgi:hypothetical protein
VSLRRLTADEQSCQRLASVVSGGGNGRVLKKNSVELWLLLRKVKRTVVPTWFLLWINSE